MLIVDLLQDLKDNKIKFEFKRVDKIFLFFTFEVIDLYHKIKYWVTFYIQENVIQDLKSDFPSRLVGGDSEEKLEYKLAYL